MSEDEHGQQQCQISNQHTDAVLRHSTTGDVAKFGAILTQKN